MLKSNHRSISHLIWAKKLFTYPSYSSIDLSHKALVPHLYSIQPTCIHTRNPPCFSTKHLLFWYSLPLPQKGTIERTEADYEPQPTLQNWRANLGPTNQMEFSQSAHSNKPKGIFSMPMATLERSGKRDAKHVDMLERVLLINVILTPFG